MSDSSHAAPAGDRKRRIIESTLAFFASVIRSGEPWTMECIDALDRARTAVAALSSGETPAEPTGLPPGESAQRNEVCDALAELIRAVAEIAEGSGESPILDIRRERHEGKYDGSLTVRALLRFMTTCDPEGRDGPYGELVQRTWRRVGRALSSAPPATEPGDAPSDDVEELTEIIWWLLGERDEFPSPPDDLTDVIACGRKERRRPGIEDKPIRLYWWRGALRGRFDNWARNYHERQARRASRAGGTV